MSADTDTWMSLFNGVESDLFVDLAQLCLYLPFEVAVGFAVNALRVWVPHSQQAKNRYSVFDLAVIQSKHSCVYRPVASPPNIQSFVAHVAVYPCLNARDGSLLLENQECKHSTQTVVR